MAESYLAFGLVEGKVNHQILQRKVAQGQAGLDGAGWGGAGHSSKTTLAKL